MEYLDAQRAAEYLGVEESTLYAYVSRGEIESVRSEDDGRRRKYRKSDLRRLRQKRRARTGEGPGAADAMNWGTPSLETRIAEISPLGPRYRGLALREILEDDWSFEAVAAWLWVGDQSSWNGTQLDDTRDGTTELVEPRATPIEALRRTTEMLELESSLEGAPVAAGAELYEKLLARVGPCGTMPEPPADSEAASIAERVTELLGVEAAPRNVALVEATLIVVAEHGLNASAFAGRVAASTGADLRAAVIAALAAFSGARHGGQSRLLRDVLERFDDTADARDYVRQRLDAGEALPGFGHPLYEHGDPRYRLLRRRLEAHPGASSRRLAFLDAIADEAESAGVVAPNLDAGLVAVAEQLELPVGATPMLFGCGRLAGWIAHAIEQSERDEILRPRSVYTGR